MSARGGGGGELDVSVFLRRSEGQHFDRKSLFEGPEGRKKARGRREVRDQIAEYVAAFANAEGGVLLLGVEDDGTPTGHRYPREAVEQMLRTPADRLDPPQPAGRVVEVEGVELLVFEVLQAFAPVMVVGDGYPLRMGDQTLQAKHEHIQALKFRGLVESWEARPSACGLGELDEGLLRRAREGAGLEDAPVEDYLARRRLADWRGTTLQLREAAEWLFRRGLPEHPNAGVRVFRVIGTERRLGLEHNVEELPRIEGPVPEVLERAFQVISGLLRRPSRLTAGGRFKQTWEYPEFSWKEALLNAVAHRDYAVMGRGVEVWLFDDRMEVTSPGGLLPEVSLDRVLAMERVHVSRNPRLVRGLVDLGFMRDQGEGIPRMFAEMEAEFLPLPELVATPHEVRVTLRNTMTLSPEDRAFIESLGGEELTPQEFRALFEAFRAGRVDNAAMRAIAGLDTLGASKMLRRLCDRLLLQPHRAGSATFYTLGPAVRVRPRVGMGSEWGLDLKDTGNLPGSQRKDFRAESSELGAESSELGAESSELGAESSELGAESSELGPERSELGAESGELGAESSEFVRRIGPANRGRASAAGDLGPEHAVPERLRGEIAKLGKRPGERMLRRLILRLCEDAPRDVATLAAILDRHPEALKRHLRAMVEQGLLAHQFPEQPTHPRQAYVATQAGLDYGETEP